MRRHCCARWARRGSAVARGAFTEFVLIGVLAGLLAAIARIDCLPAVYARLDLELPLPSACGSSHGCGWHPHRNGGLSGHFGVWCSTARWRWLRDL